MQVEGHRERSLLRLPATGARVSNAYPTCPVLGHSPLKGGLIPDVSVSGPPLSGKGLPVRDGDASD